MAYSTSTTNSPPPFTKLPHSAFLADIENNITLRLLEFNFTLRAQDLVQYRALFSTLPLIGERIFPPYYVAGFRPDGSFQFYPPYQVPQPNKPPPGQSADRIIQSFLGLLSVIYDRRIFFHNMEEVRDVCDMCCDFGLLHEVSDYMNNKEHFPGENQQVLSTIHKAPVMSMILAETLHNRFLYSQAFTLLAGQVVNGGRPRFLSGHSGALDKVSVETRERLLAAYDRTMRRFERTEQRLRKVMAEFRGLLGDFGVDSGNIVFDRFASLWTVFTKNLHRNPNLYRMWREIILAVEQHDGWKRNASPQMIMELAVTKRELAEFLQNALCSSSYLYMPV
ncbi:hypothetical protein P170DRAFT_513521 [Aspergillus steynii IBT 23096]|uniref:Uncharacterized protein n=1 Tax=Aspergillus steynii IBT 23096 TaxID=1392250 RepID=A0A2I2FUJ1_9EURO|nr:uncharacterized protein P170DRAFT_513521 [Aspergillus steynii IBT 23096]PLB44310.1 hypothetical protein P170DRAFT_513521 [Aspergillus steynii IBT 23096]